MIHIVFSTWEQGFETSSAECPLVEPYTEKIGFYRVHWTLVT